MSNFDSFRSEWTGRRVDYDGVYLASPILYLGFFTSCYRFIISFKQPKNNNSIVDTDTGFPFAMRRIRLSYSNMSGSIVTAACRIAQVSSVQYCSQVLSPVVKRISVDMVDNQSRRFTHDITVQFNNSTTLPSIKVYPFLKIRFTALNNYAPRAAHLFDSFIVVVVKLGRETSMSLTRYCHFFHRFNLPDDTKIVKEVYA